MFVWDVDAVFIGFGPIEIRYYGIFFLTAIMGGYFIWQRRMLNAGRKREQAERFLLYGVVSVIIGARIGHVLFYEPARFLENPLEILYFWKGGLASHGATVGLVIAVYLFSLREKMRYGEISDLLAPSFAWAAGWVRVGNFFNSEIVGRPSDLPWAVKFPRHDWALPLAEVPARHPSQIYEFLLGAAVLGSILVFERFFDGDKKRGGSTCLFLLLYFSGRFCVEFVKAYQTLNAESWALTMGQLLSLPFILAGAIGFFLSLRRSESRA